ncbi:hypothetical protein [Hymenobacter cellulosivorans]|uniref:DUF3341 domain-containing protein n=1 Tax=Hymenobacter cellulosivorans TaxID=2932249 RepID=A0ABY4FED0_9BACT|nr:hypothetical protein [Hymenobacter cellulosivorans]UOQ54481.1 hypothetical protein MUN80_06885 [Hymenobacter cellulosivorans]
MLPYQFYTDEFGLDEHTIYFLRNRFRYASLPLAEATFFVQRGADIRNWRLMLAFGVGLIGFGLWYGGLVLDFFRSGEGGRIYIEEIVVPVIPVLLGVFAVVMALRRGPTLRVQQVGGSSRTVSLRAVEKNGRLGRLLAFLQAQVPAGHLHVAPEVSQQWQS